MTERQAQRKIDTLAALEQADGNFSAAARAMGVHYATFHSRVKSYGIKARSPKQRCAITPLRDPAEVAVLVEECGGNIALVGRRLGVSRQRAHQIVRRDLLGKIY